MTSRLNRRQVLLFLVAIILPCSVLVALSLRIMSQQRELAEKRRAEEHRGMLNEVRHDLLTRLEKIKLQQVAALAATESEVPPIKFTDPAIVLVGWVAANRLVLTSDSNHLAERSRLLLGEPKFAAIIKQGEREEFQDHQFAKAAALYGKAMDGASHPTQAAFARLLRTRALIKSGQRGEALAHLRKSLSLSWDVTDEQGIPLCLYAADRLLEAGVDQQAVLERMRSETQAIAGAPPAVAYMVRRLMETAARSASKPDLQEAANSLGRAIHARIQVVDQASALESDFPNLGFRLAGPGKKPGGDPLWIPYGDETWLVGLAPPFGRIPAMAIAIRAKDVFAELPAAVAASNGSVGQVQWAVGAGSKGDLLGESFPGLKVRFLPASPPAAGGLAHNWDPQRSFYLFTLLLVLSATLFGAYLLWRDVRRELRLAEMRSQFVASVTHELKTPLTAIRMFAETLRLGRAADPETQDEYLETIVNESERLTRLLNNVLDFSKIEKGQRTYRFEPADLAEVVRQVARTMEYPLSQRGLHLRLEIENRLPAVTVDSDAIEQAVLNLLANAAKYCGNSHEIDLRLISENGDAVIQVVDRGVGIPVSEQSRIFEKFYRAPTPENRQIPGAGLGLTIVEHIAKAHGGRVEVQSAPGKGSTFSLYLPLDGRA